MQGDLPILMLCRWLRGRNRANALDEKKRQMKREKQREKGEREKKRTKHTACLLEKRELGRVEMCVLCFAFGYLGGLTIKRFARSPNIMRVAPSSTSSRVRACVSVTKSRKGMRKGIESARNTSSFLFHCARYFISLFSFIHTSPNRSNRYFYARNTDLKGHILLKYAY